MATPMIYKSSDAGAPLLTTGQAYTVLKQCLVTGYGAKAGAGWTLAFDDSVNKKAVFKNVHGDCALRVDSGANTSYSTIQAADDFSDIDTPIGGLWQGSALLALGNFVTSGNRPWMVFATGELVIFYANITAGLTETTSASTSAIVIGVFGRITPLGDNTVENVVWATNSHTASGGTINMFSLSGSSFGSIFCQKDYLGGVTGARSAVFTSGMVSRYQVSAGVYGAAAYPGAAGPLYSTVAKVPGEKFTLFRESGAAAGHLPILVPYFRFDPATQGVTIDDTMTIDGVVHTILNVGNNNPSTTFARVLVPHDGW